MKVDWKWIRLAGAAAIMLLGTGCSGLRASKSISPLDFLLPGIGGMRGFRGEIKPPPSATNTPSITAPLPPESLPAFAESN